MKVDAIGTHAEAARTIGLRREYFLAWKALGMLEAVFADAPQGALDTARDAAWRTTAFVRFRGDGARFP
jgi:hypothetical protein